METSNQQKELFKRITTKKKNQIIHIHKCTQRHIYTHTYIHICIHTYTNKHINTYTYKLTYVPIMLCDTVPGEM